MEARWVTEQSDGVALVGAVIRLLSSLANTPATVADERWRIPLPLDPRGVARAVTIFDAQGEGTWYVGVRELSSDVAFVSPFINDVTVVEATSTAGGVATELDYFPASLSALRRALVISHFGELHVRARQIVKLGEVIVDHCGGGFAAPFRPGTQVAITVGGRRAPVDISLGSILEVDGQKVLVAKA